MDNIFSYDYSLTTIDLSNWETPSLINMSSAFDDCTHVTSILLTKFDTSNVLDMSYAFNQLDSLQELDISNFDTRKVKSFKRMFNNSTNLRHIYIGENWDTSANEDEAIYVFPQTSYLPNFDVNDSTRQNISHAHTGDGGYLELKTNN